MLEKFGGAVCGILCVLLAFSSMALADERTMQNLTGLMESSVQSVVAAASTSTKFEGQSSEGRTDGTVSPSDLPRRPGAGPDGVEWRAPELTLQLSQGDGVKVTGPAGGRKEKMPVLQFGVSYGHTLGSVDTRLTRNNQRFDGENIDVSTPSLRGDVRLFLSGLANLGNLPNLGNLGNLGPSDCYLGLQGAVGLGSGDTGLNLKLEGVQVDKRLERNFRGSVTPYVGCSIFRFPNQNGYLNLHAGPRISFIDYRFKNNETGGGGTDHEDKKSQTAVGAAFGTEYNLEMDRRYYGGLQGGVQLGAWGEFVPGTSLSTTTQPFNFNYKVEANDTFLYTIRVGAFIKF